MQSHLAKQFVTATQTAMKRVALTALPATVLATTAKLNVTQKNVSTTATAIAQQTE